MSMIIQPARFPAGAPPAALVKFDPAISGAEILFTNSDKTLEYLSGAAETSGARVNYARKTGKWYFEVVIDNRTSGTTANDNLTSCGIARIDYGSEMIGFYGLGATVFNSGSGNGRFWVDGDIFVDLGQTGNGNRYDFAVDLDAKLIWCRRNGGNWNGSGTANPATGVGGAALGDLGDIGVAPMSTVYFAGDKHTYKFLASEFVGAVPSGYAEWPSDTALDNTGLGYTVLNGRRNTNVTMSGGNLTATRTGTNATARSKDQKDSGKFYVEYTIGTWNGTGDNVGFAEPDATAANIVANGSDGCYVYRSGTIWVLSGNRGTLGAVANGDRIDAAIDLDADLVWFRKNGGNWNGSGTANPATGVGGISLSGYVALAPSMGFGDGGSNGSNATANLGASSFVGAVPSGFTAGWPRHRDAPSNAPKVRYMWVGGLS